jgi:hypothetical protein
MGRKGQEIVSLDRLEGVVTTVDRIEALMAALMERNMQHEYQVIKRLAMLPPAIRLIVNLKELMSTMANQTVTSVLVDGLSREAREVLASIDRCMPLEIRRTAHSLFDIERRMVFLHHYGDLFRDLKTRDDHRMVQRPLDF